MKISCEIGEYSAS